MARVFPISSSSAVMLTDDGKIAAFADGRPLDPDDREAMLELLLVAAVEADYLQGQLRSATEGFQEAMRLAEPALRESVL